MLMVYFWLATTQTLRQLKLIIETPVNQDIVNDPLDENIVWREIVQIDSIAHPECPILKVRVSMIFRQKNK